MSTHAVVKITVDRIDGPMWNSNDGREWRGNADTPVFIFSKVQATVDEVLIGDPVASPVEIYAHGDASVRYEGKEMPERASISGGFTPGQGHIVLLRRTNFPTESGPVSTWTLARNFEGNWRVEGDYAFGSDSNRSMTLVGLRKFLRDNWTDSRPAQ